MKKGIVNLAKVSLAAATLVAIAAWIVIADERGGVEPAHADIADWVSLEALVDGDFGRVVEGSGLKPRPYLLNGNQVFFAVAYSDRSPDELLTSYQEAFEDSGLNERAFEGVPTEKFSNSLEKIRSGDVAWSEEVEAYNNAILNGGVVPLVQRPGYMAMGGLVPKSKSNNLREVVSEFDGFDGFEGYADGFRFIDAQQMHPEMPTRITSVWSEEGFSFDKMASPNQAGVAPVVDAPSCLGCTTGTVMKSLSKSEPYRITQFHGSQSPFHVARFYDRAMAGRGWEPSPSTRAVEFARRFLGTVPEARVLSFSRGNQVASVTVFPSREGTTVTIVESD